MNPTPLLCFQKFAQYFQRAQVIVRIAMLRRPARKHSLLLRFIRSPRIDPVEQRAVPGARIFGRKSTGPCPRLVEREVGVREAVDMRVGQRQRVALQALAPVRVGKAARIRFLNRELPSTVWKNISSGISERL